jgi:hypothetical protein
MISHLDTQKNDRESMFGPYMDKVEVPSTGGLKVGDSQTFTFPKNSNNPIGDGPKRLSPQERANQQFPKPIPPKPGKQRLKKDLKADLVSRGVIQESDRKKLTELQELARSCDPPVPTHEPPTNNSEDNQRARTKAMTVGWDGAPKGIFQILYETGWIDPIYLHAVKILPKNSQRLSG